MFFLDKKIKQKLNVLLNTIKNPHYNSRVTKANHRKSPKVLFYKKYNKLYFRGGRNGLHDYMGIKKYMIQKYMTKKFNNSVKKNFELLKNQNHVVSALIQCNLFFTFKDAVDFIKIFGILVNNRVRYLSKTMLSPNDKFAVITTLKSLVFFKKRKKNVIKLLKKIKIYKYRVKKYSTKKNYKWLPMQTWLLENNIFYFSKTTDIEFDARILTGIKLYADNQIQFNTFYDKLNLTLYMTRSYNWKYLT